MVLKECQGLGGSVGEIYYSALKMENLRNVERLHNLWLFSLQRVDLVVIFKSGSLLLQMIWGLMGRIEEGV